MDATGHDDVLPARPAATNISSTKVSSQSNAVNVCGGAPPSPSRAGFVTVRCNGNDLAAGSALSSDSIGLSRKRSQSSAVSFGVFWCSAAPPEPVSPFWVMAVISSVDSQDR